MADDLPEPTEYLPRLAFSEKLILAYSLCNSDGGGY